jgi:hypothetical protein
MKKISLLFIALALTTSALVAQVRFGIQAGPAFSSMTMKADGLKLSYNKTGFTAGVLAELPISESGIHFRPALNFVQKGGELEGASINLNYLELPLDFVYKLEAGPGKLFLGAGPSFAFGLSGKSKSGGDSEDIEFGSGEEEIKPLDLGGNFLAGYELSNGLFLSFNYNLGFSNISNSEEGKINNNYFGIRLGYLFGGNK